MRFLFQLRMFSLEEYFFCFIASKNRALAGSAEDSSSRNSGTSPLLLLNPLLPFNSRVWVEIMMVTSPIFLTNYRNSSEICLLKTSMFLLLLRKILSVIINMSINWLQCKMFICNYTNIFVSQLNKSYSVYGFGSSLF